MTLRSYDLPVPRDGATRTAAELLSLEGITLARLRAIWPELGHIPGQLHQQLEADCRYASYFNARRQRGDDIDALKRDEAMKIPANLDFSTVEAACRLRPVTCSHATAPIQSPRQTACPG